MKRKFISNLLLLLFLNALVKPFWIFGIDRTVQNTLGADEYGLYFSLFGFSMLLNILLDAGITNYNNRSISRDPEKISEYFSLFVPIKFILGVVYAFATLIIAWIIGYSKVQFHILGFLIINQFLAAMILYLRSNITGLHRFKTDSILSVLDRLLMILLIGLALWSKVFPFKLNIYWFVYLQTAAYLATALVAFILVRTNTSWFRPVFSWPKTLDVFRETLPFALLTLLSALYYRVDSVMIERMLPDGKVQAGIYAQAFRILDAFTMYGYLFGVILLPLFSRMIKEKKKVGELVRLAFLLLMMPVVSLSIISIILNKPVMELLYHAHTEDSSRIFAVLMGAFVFVSGVYLFGVLLTAYGDMKSLNRIAGAGFLVNVVLNAFLIPRHGAIGSAWASLVTTAGVTLLQVWFVHKRFSLSFAELIPGRIILFIVLLTGTGIGCRTFVPDFAVTFVILTATAILLGLVFRLLPFRQMLSILASNEE